MHNRINKWYQVLVGKRLWPLYEGTLRGRPTFRYEKEFESNQWLTTEELQTLQWERLGRLLRHAYDTSPYYRESFDAAGLRPEDIRTPCDFAKLPIVEKSTVRQNIDRMVSSAFQRGSLVRSATGGSTGEPMQLFYDRNSYERRMAAAMRGDSWAGWKLCGGEFYIWGVTLLPQSNFKKIKGHLYHAFLRRYIVNSFDMVAERIGALARDYNKLRPRVVVGYTNAVYQFALDARAAGVKLLPPLGVITSAEKLHSYQREVIEEVFGARVFNRYGCREVMMIGAECEEHFGLHTTSDNLYIEIVKNGVPCRPGELGEVLLTDLHNYGMPLIRYKVGDVASWKDHQCPCGRGLPLLNVVEGRTFGLISTPSGRVVSGALFPHLFKDFPAIRAFKVIQEVKDQITIRLSTSTDFADDDYKLLQGTVIKTLGQEMRINWEVGPNVQIEQEQKFNPVISKIPVNLGAISDDDIVSDPSEQAPALNSRKATRRLRPGGPRRIAHVVSSLQVGGMEQFVLRIAYEQQKLGYDVSIVALRGGPLKGEAERLGIRTFVLGEGSAQMRFLRGTAVIARLNPQIVNSHNPTSLHYATLGRSLRGAKIVFIRHGQLQRQALSRRWWKSDAVIAVSEAAANVMRSERPEYSSRISVIRNGVQISEPEKGKAEVREELGLNGRMVGILVARIDTLKGHNCLAKALALLQPEEDKITVLIVGDGPERSNIEELCKELKVGPDRMRFLGFRSDVPDLLAASDFFLLPSLTEGLPLSVLEAMSQSLPIIATPVGGVPELVTDGVHGILVPVEEPQPLADAMQKLAASPELRASMGAEGLKRVLGDFSFDRMMEQYDRLYYSLHHES